MLREPLQGDAGRQELAHEVDQVHLEVRELQKQVSELEKHLATAPAAPDCVTLGRQVSARPRSAPEAAVPLCGPSQGSAPQSAPQGPFPEVLCWP